MLETESKPDIRPFSKWTARDVLERASSGMGAEHLLVKKEDTPECDRAYPVIKKGEIFVVQTFGEIIIEPNREMEKVGELSAIDEKIEK